MASDVLTTGSPAAAAAGPEPAIVAAGLRKTFGPINAVDGIDLELAPGRIYGLLGPNGSGKTTLIRLLVGLAHPTSGEARVLGQPMPSRAGLGRIGYMTQSDGIYGELSVWENIRFFAALYGVRDQATLEEALSVVDLLDRRSTIVNDLSGGLRRRLSLACALVHRPAILFLDEPTVGIDPALRIQFWEHFRRLSREGVTLLVSSHVMDEADRCDELLLMQAGRVIARGTGDELRAAAGATTLEEVFLQAAGVDAPAPVGDGAPSTTPPGTGPPGAAP